MYALQHHNILNMNRTGGLFDMHAYLACQQQSYRQQCLQQSYDWYHPKQWPACLSYREDWENQEDHEDPSQKLEDQEDLHRSGEASNNRPRRCLVLHHWGSCVCVYLCSRIAFFYVVSVCIYLQSYVHHWLILNTPDPATTPSRFKGGICLFCSHVASSSRFFSFRLLWYVYNYLLHDSEPLLVRN